MKELATKKNELIIEQIHHLGIANGDIVFLTADLLRVGFYEKNPETTYRLWIDILIEIVGESGTLVIPAYSNFFSKYFPDPNCIFDLKSPTISGSLSIAFSKYPNVKRSSHPTNSCFAIGPHSEYILQGHDHLSSSYLPYHRVIELNGKQLFLGSIRDSKQGPMTIHAVQEVLGLTRKAWQRGLFQCYYFDNSGSRKIFSRMDFGGCTGFGYKTIGHHFISDAITFGPVGRSFSACVDCKKSYNLMLDLFLTNKELLKCDDLYCSDCYQNRILKRYKYIYSILLKRVIKRMFSSLKL